MPQELEAKFKVSDFPEIERALQDAGAERRDSLLQRDRFFDTHARDIYGCGKGLRIRSMVPLQTSGPPTHVLTFKGPMEDHGRAKVREEIELAVEDDDALAEIFAGLGMHVFMVLEKRRTSYRLGSCNVELDELPLLGRYVEIEAPDEGRLKETAKRLRLDGEPIVDSYLHLVSQRCGRVNNGCLEITFDRCAACRNGWGRNRAAKDDPA